MKLQKHAHLENNINSAYDRHYASILISLIKEHSYHYIDAYFITFQIERHGKNAFDRTYLSKKLFREIKAITGANSSDGMSLLLCNDVEGTRSFKPELSKPLLPHVHGILCLSEQIKNMIADRNDFARTLSDWLVRRPYVRDRRSDADPSKGSPHVVPFDREKGSFENLVGYAIKAFKQDDGSGKFLGAPFIYPDPGKR